MSISEEEEVEIEVDMGALRIFSVFRRETTERRRREITEGK